MINHCNETSGRFGKCRSLTFDLTPKCQLCWGIAQCKSPCSLRAMRCAGHIFHSVFVEPRHPPSLSSFVRSDWEGISSECAVGSSIERNILGASPAALSQLMEYNFVAQFEKYLSAIFFFVIWLFTCKRKFRDPKFVPYLYSVASLAITFRFI